MILKILKTNLGGVSFGFYADILSQYIKIEDIYKIPLAKPCIQYITNQRGKVVSIVDYLQILESCGLKILANYENSKPKTGDNCLLFELKDYGIALRVDQVYELTQTEESSIKVAVEGIENTKLGYWDQLLVIDPKWLIESVVHMKEDGL